MVWLHYIKINIMDMDSNVNAVKTVTLSIKLNYYLLYSLISMIIFRK